MARRILYKALNIGATCEYEPVYMHRIVILIQVYVVRAMMSNKSKDKKKSAKKGASKRMSKAELSKVSGGAFSYSTNRSNGPSVDGIVGSTNGTGG